MESLPEFRLIAPGSVAEAVAAKAADPTARFVAGGTDLLPNLRRGIGAPATLIDLAALPGFAEIAEAGETLSIGAGVGIARLAKDARLATRFSAIVQAAGEIAGPTHRAMATVGGNLCLDTRCIYYNQSQWWRQANEFCLKHQGEVCHVAPTGKRCHAAYSGDLAPALLVHDAKAEIAGPKGTRRIPLADLYHEEGRSHLTLAADELLIRVLVPAPASGLASGYLKGRLRQSIDFPLAGAAVAVAMNGGKFATLRIGLTGTNSRPFLVEGLDGLVGRAADAAVLGEIDKAIRKQVQPMRTTLAASNYRRHLAAVLATRLVAGLAGTTAKAA